MALIPRWLARLLRLRAPAGPIRRGPGRLGPWWRDDDGGAGVREPRRPRPAPGGMSAAADPEPTLVQVLEGDDRST